MRHAAEQYRREDGDPSGSGRAQCVQEREAFMQDVRLPSGGGCVTRSVTAVHLGARRVMTGLPGYSVCRSGSGWAVISSRALQVDSGPLRQVSVNDSGNLRRIGGDHERVRGLSGDCDLRGVCTVGRGLEHPLAQGTALTSAGPCVVWPGPASHSGRSLAPGRRWGFHRGDGGAQGAGEGPCIGERLIGG